MTATAATLCRGCGAPTEAGRAWHPECRDVERKRVDYRRLTLERDGAHCVRCPQWWNRLVLSVWGAPRGCPPVCPDCRSAHGGVLGLVRRVDVDHVDPLASSTGSQLPTNWQVLCRRHHRRKTARDLASLRGLRAPLPRSRALVLVGGLALGSSALSGAYSASVWWAVWAVVMLALVAALVRRRRRRIVTRLWEALAPTLGASVTARRPIRRVRWRLERGRWRVRSFELRYPHTLDDSNPEVQTGLQRRVAAKLGSSWCAAWQTTADRVRFSSPDPLADPRPLPWAVPAAGVSLWDPVPIGVGEDGRPVEVRLVGKNLLIGGEPGGGKSVALSELVPVALADPDVTVHLVDGKRVEFAKFAAGAASVVHTQEQFRELLEELIAAMEMRYDMLLAEGREQVERGDGYGLHVLFIDELAFFVTGGKKADREAVLDQLRDLIQRGRAAGIIVVAATQRPSADVIPTMIRDLFGYRWALRCSTPSSSDMVLGQGWASRGFSAAAIDAAMRGVGLLLHEGGTPVRLRTYLPEREQLLASVATSVDARRHR